MDAQQLERARKLRRMQDADAFDFLVNGFEGCAERRRLQALQLVGHRSWKRQFHQPLVSTILRDIHGDAFRSAIKIFLTFVNPRLLSQELWIATENTETDRGFARYYFYGLAVEKLGRDHPAFETWLCLSGSDRAAPRIGPTGETS